MEEAHGAECIHGNVLQWPPLLNFSPWVNLTDQALSWSVFKFIHQPCAVIILSFPALNSNIFGDKLDT